MIKDLLAKIHQVDFDEIQNFRRPLLQMVLLEDENFMERLKKVIAALLECLKTEASYFKYCDSIVDILHKIMLKSPIASNIFLQYQ